MKEEKTDDLLKKIADLEARLEDEKKSSDHWFKESNKAVANLNKYKTAIKGIMALME